MEKSRTAVSGLDQAKPRRKYFLQRCLSFFIATISVFVSTQSTSAWALDNDQRYQAAKDSAMRAAMIQSGIQDLVDRLKSRLEGAVARVGEETGTGPLIALASLGVRTIRDQRLTLKGKNPFIRKSSYRIGVNRDRVVDVELNGENPFVDNSNYKINATINSVRVGIQFNF